MNLLWATSAAPATVEVVEHDDLGPAYQRRTLALGRDQEGPVFATLIHRPASTPTHRAVLWVHGWSDYFFQTHVADYFTTRGFTFYALDLRKYGRSLRPHQTPTFCYSLTEYYQELDIAAEIIRDEHEHTKLLVAGHSTGGLITALWAHDRRGQGLVDAMFLNSPFFDFNLPPTVRGPALEVATRVGRYRPYRTLHRPTFPTYGLSLHADYRGEWSYNLAWKPLGGFPVRYGWLAAIRAGQQRLHAGLSVDAPVLVACSTRSSRHPRWHKDAYCTDTVLNVADMIRWAPHVGRHVTLLQVDGGMHDLTLSRQPVRQELFSELDRWLAAYLVEAAPLLPHETAAAGLVDHPAVDAPAPVGGAPASHLPQPPSGNQTAASDHPKTQPPAPRTSPLETRVRPPGNQAEPIPDPPGSTAT